MLLELFARKEDDVVVIYRDRKLTDVFCSFDKFRKRPDRRNKYITLNCYRWKLNWVDI